MPGKKSLSSMSITKKLWLITMLLSATASCIVIVSGLSRPTLEIETINNNSTPPARSPAARQEQVAIGMSQTLGKLALLPEIGKPDSEACNG